MREVELLSPVRDDCEAATTAGMIMRARDRSCREVRSRREGLSRLAGVDHVQVRGMNVEI